MRSGFFFDSRLAHHRTACGHPESSNRLIAVMEYLKTFSWFKAISQFKSVPVEEGYLCAVHAKNYLERAKQTCQNSLPYLDDPDVSISLESYDIAVLAAGGALSLADGIMRGDIQNGFALVRPPGHHAEANRAMGFCILNHAAIAARYLQNKYGLEKILILDWDVHHGNGTQHQFETDPSVFYISLHQYPLYPGTGAASEKGTGKGYGYTLNCPMPAGARDEHYEHVFTETILPACELYKPQAVILSAGFDAHENDPLADICLSTDFFGWMTERVLEIASKHAEGRILSLLEGGYDLETLAMCVERHVSVLSGSKKESV